MPREARQFLKPACCGFLCVCQLTVPEPLLGFLSYSFWGVLDIIGDHWGPSKPPRHHIAVIYTLDFSGALNYSPMMPRGPSFSAGSIRRSSNTAGGCTAVDVVWHTGSQNPAQCVIILGQNQLYITLFKINILSYRCSCCHEWKSHFVFCFLFLLSMDFGIDVVTSKCAMCTKTRFGEHVRSGETVHCNIKCWTKASNLTENCLNNTYLYCIYYIQLFGNWLYDFLYVLCDLLPLYMGKCFRKQRV